MGTKIWMIVFPLAGQSVGMARWIENAGWDGLAVADTQNLAGDPYSALSLAAHNTSQIGLGTATTNATTRHPAVTASAITTVQVESRGRAVLGIGRGDSSLAYLGRKPASLVQFKTYLQQVQGYLRGEEVSIDGYASRMEWVTQTGLPKVPVDVAATGPKVIEIGAQFADWVTLSVGAQPERLRWGMETAHQARLRAGLDPAGLSLGAYVNVVAHPNRARARELARGWVSSFARFSGMLKGEAMESLAPEGRSVVTQISEQYNMSYHGHQAGEHTAALTDDFIDSFAIAGPSSYCVERLQELMALGFERLVIVGPGRGTDPTEMKQIMLRFSKEVLPGLRSL
ncbi:MAG TPA: LLM class flavin-dependent oxidoreductase [Ktedonobacteraceae bacterium]|jgi:5,10-methylenetetrahydromethanopterin reductase